MVSVMKPIRITAAGERIVEPIIALAHCSKLARIIVTGANSAEAVIDLHRLGYARAATTLNCGLPAGQYDVVVAGGIEQRPRHRGIVRVQEAIVDREQHVDGPCDAFAIVSRRGLSGTLAHSGRLPSRTGGPMADVNDALASNRDAVLGAPGQADALELCEDRPGKVRKGAVCSASAQQWQSPQRTLIHERRFGGAEGI